jgi:plasmid stabilization system protein ParE
MCKFIIADSVFIDLNNILAYFAEQFAVEAYGKLKNQIQQAYQTIKHFPESGARIRAKRFRHYRFILAEPYYIFYVYDGNTVTIKRVVHTSRNYKKILETE